MKSNLPDDPRFDRFDGAPVITVDWNNRPEMDPSEFDRLLVESVGKRYVRTAHPDEILKCAAHDGTRVNHTFVEELAPGVRVRKFAWYDHQGAAA